MLLFVNKKMGPGLSVKKIRARTPSGPLKSDGTETQIPSKIGGAEGARTPDLMHAMHALSQLSYSPTFHREQ